MQVEAARFAAAVRSRQQPALGYSVTTQLGAYVRLYACRVAKQLLLPVISQSLFKRHLNVQNSVRFNSRYILMLSLRRGELRKL
jgi:hypothetical protein